VAVTVTGSLYWAPSQGPGSDWMDWTSPPWARDALCREPAYAHLDFVPRRAQPTKPLKDVCRRCLVRQQCLAFALADGSLAGIWGGTSEPERAELRRSLNGADARFQPSP
jgi:hypothetical protein